MTHKLTITIAIIFKIMIRKGLKLIRITSRSWTNGQNIDVSLVNWVSAKDCTDY